MFLHFFKNKQVPVKVMEVIEEELTKLSFLEQHSSEFKLVHNLSNNSYLINIKQIDKAAFSQSNM